MSQLIERAVVKPLEWERGNSGSHDLDYFDAEAAGLVYCVLGGRWWLGDKNSEIYGDCASTDAAKAAAQADYEARILSALTQPPSPVAAEGYVLVPVAPTRDMYEGGDAATSFGSYIEFSEFVYCYGVMLAARPPIGETVPGAGWQPIETTPKDFSVIVAAPCDGHYIVGEARYFADRDSDTGWWWAGESPGDYYADKISPDPEFWQPLPAPPFASTQEGEAP